MHMVFGSIYLAWFGFILDFISCCIFSRGGSRIFDEGVQMAKGGFVLVLLPKFA